MKVYRIASLDEYTHFQAVTQKSYKEHLDFLRSLLPRREKRFFLRGFSYTAGKNVRFRSDFLFASGYPRVNWRERVVCPVTGLNNRMRAAVHVFDLFGNTYEDDPVGLDHNSVHPPVMRPAESGRAPLASAVVVGAGAAAAACAR
jgi:hypothetical protein